MQIVFKILNLSYSKFLFEIVFAFRLFVYWNKALLCTPGGPELALLIRAMIIRMCQDHTLSLKNMEKQSKHSAKWEDGINRQYNLIIPSLTEKCF